MLLELLAARLESGKVFLRSRVDWRCCADGDEGLAIGRSLADRAMPKTWRQLSWSALVANDGKFPIETLTAANLEFGLANIIGQKLDAAKESSRPIIVHMLGVPGAGKSTYAAPLFDHIRRSYAPDLTYVGFDKIMSEIPAYIETEDKVRAFSQFELPARAAGYTLVRGLIEKKASFFFDHGGAAAEHVAILRFAREHLGYAAYMVNVQCAPEVAKERILHRARTEGRHTPPNYVDERATLIDRLVPEYLKVLSGFVMIENNQPSKQGVLETTKSIADLVGNLHNQANLFA